MSTTHPVPLARTALTALVLGLAVALAAGAVLAPNALAETEEELLAKKDTWQSKYRTLLRTRDILKRNIAGLEKDYAQAQRRNYPRGGARQAFLDKANEQRALLAGIEEKIESIFREARMADVPPGWLYEIDDEIARSPMPAAKEPTDERDRDGRNPLYADDEDDDS